MQLRSRAARPLSDNDVFVPQANVLSVAHGGRLAVLSMSEQAYFTLNESAFLVWQSIRNGSTVGAASHQLMEAYGISANDARHDVCALIDALRSRRLVRASGHPTKCRRPPASVAIPLAPHSAVLPTLAQCFSCLVRMSTALRFMGAERLVPDSMSEDEPMDVAAVPDDYASAMTRRMRIAAAFLPWTGTCLPQSLATIQLLRERGYRPALRIGVHPSPFSAHAWVVCAGKPVNETPEQLLRYRVLEYVREGRP